MEQPSLNKAACHPWLRLQVAGRGGGQWGSARSFLDHEHAIWMGDLNYRIPLPDAEVWGSSDTLHPFWPFLPLASDTLLHLLCCANMLFDAWPASASHSASSTCQVIWPGPHKPVGRSSQGVKCDHPLAFLSLCSPVCAAVLLRAGEKNPHAPWPKGMISPAQSRWATFIKRGHARLSLPEKTTVSARRYEKSRRPAACRDCTCPFLHLLTHIMQASQKGWSPNQDQW